jgi:hypothetical protein
MTPQKPVQVPKKLRVEASANDGFSGALVSDAPQFNRLPKFNVSNQISKDTESNTIETNAAQPQFNRPPAFVIPRPRGQQRGFSRSTSWPQGLRTSMPPPPVPVSGLQNQQVGPRLGLGNRVMLPPPKPNIPNAAPILTTMTSVHISDPPNDSMVNKLLPIIQRSVGASSNQALNSGLQKPAPQKAQQPSAGHQTSVEQRSSIGVAPDLPARPRITIEHPFVDDFVAPKEVLPVAIASDISNYTDDDEEFVENIMSEDEVRRLHARITAQSGEIQEIEDLFEREASQTVKDIMLDTLDNREELLRPVPIPVPGKGEDRLQENAELLMDAYKANLRNLIRTALGLKGMPCDGWVRRRMTSQKTQFLTLEHVLVIMLAGMNGLVLEHLIKGDIPKAALNNPELKKTLDGFFIRGIGSITPSIYLQCLVNANGDSPSADFLLWILKDIELYMRGWRDPDDKESDERAKRIDLQVYRKGTRKYIESQAHYDTLKAWITVVKARCHNVPAEKRSQPLARPLSEIGWAKDLEKRLAQHRRHSSSNYLMNLTEAACNTHYGGYRIYQYGIFRVFEEYHAMLGEIMCSRIGQAYISHGGGFSHCAAGISHQGAYQLRETDYRLLRLEVANGPNFVPNMRAETRKTKQVTTDLHDAFNALEEDTNRTKLLKNKIPELYRNIANLETTIKEQNDEYIEKAAPWMALVNIMRKRKGANKEADQSRVEAGPDQIERATE